MSLNSNSCCSTLLSLVFVLLHYASQVLLAQQSATEEIVIREGFTTSPGRGAGGRGRLSIPKDPLEAAWLSGALLLPDPNLEESPSDADFPNWRRIKADEQGGLGDRALASGWLVTYVDAPSDAIWLLDAKGHGGVRVNDAPRIGDVYSNGKTELPVSLQAGRNTLVFSASRGKVTARLTRPKKKVFPASAIRLILMFYVASPTPCGARYCSSMRRTKFKTVCKCTLAVRDLKQPLPICQLFCLWRPER